MHNVKKKITVNTLETNGIWILLLLEKFFYSTSLENKNVKIWLTRYTFISWRVVAAQEWQKSLMLMTFQQGEYVVDVWMSDWIPISSLLLIFLPIQFDIYHVLSERSYILLVQNMLSNTILLQRMLWAIATVLALNFSLKMGFRGCESSWVPDVTFYFLHIIAHLMNLGIFNLHGNGI